MSYSEENSNQNNSEELESAQKNQKKVGSAIKNKEFCCLFYFIFI